MYCSRSNHRENTSINSRIYYNCWINSLYLVCEKSLKWLRIWNLTQVSCAVSCHLSRITDYFFSTNCAFKAVYNFLSYYVAILSMDLITVFIIYFSVQILLKYGYKTTIVYFIVICGLPLFAKFGTISIALFHLKGFTSDFNFCAAKFIDGIFELMMWTEVAAHSFTISFYCYFFYQNIKITTKKIPLFEKLRKSEFTYVVLMDIITIMLYSPVAVHNAGPNAEVIVQLRWALVSKCFNLALIKFLKGIEVNYNKIKIVPLNPTSCKGISNAPPYDSNAPPPFSSTNRTK